MVFVDDTDFTTDREDCQSKMQRILEKYTSLYEAIGRFVQYEKIRYYFWEWQRKNRKLLIQDKTIEFKENNRVIK